MCLHWLRPSGCARAARKRWQEVLDRWALWVSGWPGAQIWFDTAYAAVVCLLLAGALLAGVP